LAALYLKAHRLEEVIHQYIILTELSPEDLSAAIILGYLYITVGEYDKAVDVFHQAIIMHPDNITLKDDDIDRYMDQNRLNEALEGIERLLQWLPDNPAAFVKKGDIFDLMGEPLEAIAAYTKAYDIVPHSLDIALKLTSEYIQIDDFKRAAFIFNRALESNEQMLDVYLGLALSHHSTGDTHSALASLNSASMLMPTSALLYTQLVTMLLQTYVECEEAFLDIGGQNNLVLDTHRSIMAATPHNPMLHYQQGLLHYHYFGPQAALADFHTCYELNALEHRAFSKSIVCEYAIGNNYQALNDLSRLVYIDFDTTDLYYQTSLLYSDKAKFAASLLNLSQQVDSHKESALHISIILQKLGILDRTDTLWHELNEMLMGCLEAT
jgi:tetratricopeptide (TPR) repeat protein